MVAGGNHCSFVLLAEFNIHEGASLRYQFPQPLGVNEGVLAMSMLPDGAETQLDDWTIFFLNQTPFNTIAPVLAWDSPDKKPVPLPDAEEGKNGEKPDLLCVLNLVRTKHDKSLQRGAQVLALAICTKHPFIQIFKPVLLMALDDYFASPSQDCLSRLFDAVNSMDLSGAPRLTRHEKLVMRASERKDIFGEKFQQQQVASASGGLKVPQGHKPSPSVESYNTFDEGIMMRTREKERDDWDQTVRASHLNRDKSDTESNAASSTAYATSTSSQRHHPGTPSETSFTLGGSAVWVGDESSGGDDGDESSSVRSLVGTGAVGSQAGMPQPLYRNRSSTDASSSSSHPRPIAIGSYAGMASKDTHFYHTTVKYKDHQLPIKMPLSTFPEEVGDYSLITLIKVFSSPVQGPQHPHLHTNGPSTHPIIVLFNALVTGKRIMFMGHKRPAGEVSSFVLSACALGSGCGAVLRGFIERAFPYANLENRDEWESVPAYIAGVTNPIFEAFKTWDLLLDIKAGTVTVAKEILMTYPPMPTPNIGGAMFVRAGTLRPDVSLDDESSKKDAATKSDNNADNFFIEDVRAAIEYHYGESLVRVRFTEYVWRFVRLASRYEEEVYGATKIGNQSVNFNPINSQLGSGIMFNDENTCIRELSANAQRIEGWRSTNSYAHCVEDHAKHQATNPIRGFDPVHQLFRLRHAKMTDAEAIAIMRTLSDNIKTYEQVVELLVYLVPHGGLLHLGFGLFHQKEQVRDATVELFNQLRAYPVGVIFLQTLNHFQRYAYVRQAHEKEKSRVANGKYVSGPSSQSQLQQAQTQPLIHPPTVQPNYAPAFSNRTHSNSSVNLVTYSVAQYPDRMGNGTGTAF